MSRFKNKEEDGGLVLERDNSLRSCMGREAGQAAGWREICWTLVW